MICLEAFRGLLFRRRPRTSDWSEGSKVPFGRVENGKSTIIKDKVVKTIFVIGGGHRRTFPTNGTATHSLGRVERVGMHVRNQLHKKTQNKTKQFEGLQRRQALHSQQHIVQP